MALSRRKASPSRFSLAAKIVRTGFVSNRMQLGERLVKEAPMGCGLKRDPLAGKGFSGVALQGFVGNK